MRLIDADELLTKLRRIPLFERTERDKGMFYVERSCIDAMPTIDAVPVVRCKDCKYCRKRTVKDAFSDEPFVWYCGLTRYEVILDDFCSYGKRKDT